MKQTKYAIDKLPELPLNVIEQSATLVHAGIVPVLTNRPDGLVMQPPKVTPQPLDENISQFSRRYYLSQATYPKVICYPTNELSQEVAWERKADEDPSGAPQLERFSRTTHLYKLTRFNDAVLPAFGYVCTVHYGPWSVNVVEEESCVSGVPSQWRMYVWAVDLEIVWYGSWLDQPAYPLLNVIKSDLHLYQEATACCSGYRRCPNTGWCIDQIIPCGDDFRV